ncbi:hypothetical protein pb186bvf_013122 [Paramecium bursaria]
MFTRILRQQIFKPSKSTCWNCTSNEFVNRFICGECKYLKNPSNLININYFDLFEIRAGFKIDIHQLENRYRRLQQSFHPDVFISQTDINSINLNYSQEYSSFINEAYHTLKDDIQRAEYILSLHGYDVKESSTLNDLEFMEEILEIQQNIQEGINLDNIQKENDQQIQDMTNRLSQLLQQENYKAAFSIILYLRYRLRIRDQLTK